MKPITRWLLVFCVIIVAAPAVAKFRPLFDYTDIRQSPTSIAGKRGGEAVSAATKKENAQEAIRESHLAQVNRGLQSGQRDVAQNLVLKIVNSRHVPLPRMQVQATITTRGRAATRQSIVTDSNGVARVKGIKPLPAKVELAFAPDRRRSDGGPEWSTADPRQSVLLLKQPEGRRVAEASGDLWPDQASSDEWGGRVIFAAYVPVAARHSSRPAPSVVYESTKAIPIVLRRNAIDFELTALADTRVYRPSAGEGEPEYPVGTVSQDGTLRFQLDTYLFGAGTIPLRLAKSVPGGELEAIVENYPHDPYAGINRIAVGRSLSLTRVSEIHVNGEVDVLVAASDVERSLGRKPKITKNADGSEWRQSDNLGLWVRVRPGGTAFGERLKSGTVDRVRLVDHKGGSVGGISVGDDWGVVSTRLGSPEREDADGAHYLSNGLVFKPADGKVASVDIARPIELLVTGTTAFVQRPPVTVFVSSFKGDQRCQVRSISEFKRYLSQMGAVRVVTSQADADYTLSASTTFEDGKDEFLDTIPFKYEARTRLVYNLRPRTGSGEDENLTIEGVSKADYSREVLGTAGIIVLLDQYLKHRDLPDWQRLVVGALLGKISIDHLKASMTRAIQRCPRIAEQSAFNQLSNRLYNLADFRATVTSIDYQKGSLTFNVGSAEGVVKPSPGHQPTIFELYLGKPDPQRPLNEGSLKANYYAAEVAAVSEHECIAKLRHIDRSVTKSRENLSITDATDAVQQIPDPMSGIVSGRMRVRFLPLSGEVAQ
jgi:hypothetical protein